MLPMFLEQWHAIIPYAVARGVINCQQTMVMEMRETTGFLAMQLGSDICYFFLEVTAQANQRRAQNEDNN